MPSDSMERGRTAESESRARCPVVPPERRLCLFGAAFGDELFILELVDRLALVSLVGRGGRGKRQTARCPQAERRTRGEGQSVSFATLN